MNNELPPREGLSVQFAHPTYQFSLTASARKLGLRHCQTWSNDDTLSCVNKADVLVISGLWSDQVLDRAVSLRYIQSISAGYEQFPLDELQNRGIRLCTASGVNADAVSHHAMGLVLSLCRHLYLARDNQRTQNWRPWISERSQREDDLSEKTMLIVGLGEIGSRLSRLAKAFGMKVIGVKNQIRKHKGVVDEIYAPEMINDLLEIADFSVLCCPLTKGTENIIDAEAFSKMRSSSYLVNVARGGCVEEKALLKALTEGQIAGAAIDHFCEEPLPASSPFWNIPNLIITPHSAGETAKYEGKLIDVLLENLDRLYARKTDLINQVV